MKMTDAESLALVKLCCHALDEKKAGNVRVLDVRGLSSITNYLIIVTATSEPHVRALRVELEKVLDAAKAHIVGVETAKESGWTVMDAFDVMVHIFAPEMRSRYGLEKLWKDADEVSLARLFGEKKAPSSKKVRSPKKTLKAPKPRKAVKKPVARKKKGK
jgi:ribosome-associated protein